MRQGGLILEADRVPSKRKKNEKEHTKKSSPPKTPHDIHISPATATTPRRRRDETRPTR